MQVPPFRHGWRRAHPLEEVLQLEPMAVVFRHVGGTNKTDERSTSKQGNDVPTLLLDASIHKDRKGESSDIDLKVYLTCKFTSLGILLQVIELHDTDQPTINQVNAAST
jgi:hypothetical protein